MKPTRGQIDDLQEMIRERVAAEARVLVTTLTKKMAEDLTDYLLEMGVRVRYLHSEVDTLARIEILRDLRLGHFDVLVGINLLREGLDLPEVSLVAILDADKEGFLRSETSLIQTMGRAARNVDGQVVMYADVVTGSMRRALDETNRRRALQQAHNAAHGISPQTIRKARDRHPGADPSPTRRHRCRLVTGASVGVGAPLGGATPRGSTWRATTCRVWSPPSPRRCRRPPPICASSTPPALRDEIAELRREMRDIAGAHALGV